LTSIDECILNACRSLQKDMETWMQALIGKNSAPLEVSFYYYLLGRASYGQGKIQQAIDAFIASYQNDTMYLHPLLELGVIYVRLGKTGPAEKVLGLLQKANKTSRHPRDEEIKRLQEMLVNAKASATASNGQ
jgi:tetratricopeptide (TPR) repeat protein